MRQAPAPELSLPYGSRHARGYGTAWDKLRKVVLRRDMWLCQECSRHGRTTPAKDVDHIKRKADGGTDQLDNLQSLCRPCHIAKTRAENQGLDEVGLDGWSRSGDNAEG